VVGGHDSGRHTTLSLCGTRGIGACESALWESATSISRGQVCVRKVLWKYLQQISGEVHKEAT
jgi:hypothetical protein